MEDVKEQEEEMEDEEGSDVDEKKPTVIPQRISISLSDLGCTSLYITDEGKTVRLNSSDNKYYNVLSLNPLDKVGLYYWEVLIQNVTNHELKIGVVTQSNIPSIGDFTDINGFAYHGTGQRVHSKSSSIFGELLNDCDVIGVCVNTMKGTMSFSKNGEYLG